MHDIAVDIAMLPVSGTYVMTPEEAAEAALAIHPKLPSPCTTERLWVAMPTPPNLRALVKHCQVEIVLGRFLVQFEPQRGTAFSW